LPSARSSRHSRGLPRSSIDHLPPDCATGPAPPAASAPLPHTRTVNVRPRQDHGRGRLTAPAKRTAGCAHYGHLIVPGAPPAARTTDTLSSRPAHAWCKGPQVHWAQPRAGVRPTDSPHTGEARAG
jgi:hypothetical protein